MNIEHAKGVPIYKRELQFSYGGNGLRSASGWGADGEHVILVDYPRLREFLHWGEEYFFTITTLDAIPSKGLGDQFLSFYYLSK